MNDIKIAQCDRNIERCFPLMQQLRPHLLQAEFISRIKYQQQQYGYQLAYLENA